MKAKRRTLAVGLDAACWEYLDPLVNSGRAPTLRRLIDTGVSGTLTSTIPAITPVAWSSIITGKNPGKHGVFDMLARRPGSRDFSPVNAHSRVGTPFWQRLNECGYRVGLVNVPFSHPPDELQGFIVCGFGTPSSADNMTYPKDLLGWIERKFGDYEPEIDLAMIQEGTQEEIIGEERHHQDRQVRIAAELARECQVDVLVINLMLPDHANHYLSNMELVEKAICDSDADIEFLINEFRPDNVMVFSDHGSRRVKGDFLLSAWLRDHGYCVQLERTQSDRSAALNWILVQWLQRHFKWSGLHEKGLRRIIRTIIPRVPDSVMRRFMQLVERGVPFATETYLLSDHLDYHSSTIFPGAQFSSLLYLNTQEFTPSGPVGIEERSELVSELSRRLSAILDPQTNAPLFRDIYAPQMIYKGAATIHSPDFIIDGYDSPWNISTSFKRGARVGTSDSRYFVSNLYEFGHHSRDGIMIFCGEDFDSRDAPLNGHVLDIPATLLRLHDVPIPEDYDGRVLNQVFTDEFISQHPQRKQEGDPLHQRDSETTYSESETEELFERLRALGYVE